MGFWVRKAKGYFCSTKKRYDRYGSMFCKTPCTISLSWLTKKKIKIKDRSERSERKLKLQAMKILPFVKKIAKYDNDVN